MNKNNVIERENREGIADPLDQLLRAGAQQLIQQAVGEELEELLAQHGGRRSEAGTAGIVRNGFFPNGNCRPEWGQSRLEFPRSVQRPGIR